MTTPTPELMPEIVYLYSNGNVTEYMVHYEQHSPHKDWTKYVRADKYEKVLEDYHTLSRIKSTPPAQSDEVAEAMQFLFGNKHKGGFVKDLCYTVWDLCHNPTHEDGNTDWFNDTLPTVEDGKKIIQEKVQALTTPPAQQQEGVVEALEGELRRLAGIILNCETCSNKMLEPIDTAAYRKGEKS